MRFFLRLARIPAIMLMAATAGAATPQRTPLTRVQSAERKAILDAMRPKLEKEFKTKLVFEVICIWVKTGWAVVRAEPKRPDGRKLPLLYPDPYDIGGGNTITASLHMEGGRWYLIASDVGSTDASFVPFVPEGVVGAGPCTYSDFGHDRE